MEDVFKTIANISKSTYTEKRSKFIAYAIPVQSVEDVKIEIDRLRKEYYDSRHVCWAYMLGAERAEFRSNDDGEPSGTAGKPILGQINSNELTNILVAVIRYFGGIKLGTSGLIVAYREAAAEVIAESEIIEKTVDCQVSFSFEYPFMNDVMKIVKDLEPLILNQSYDMDCLMTLEIRKARFEELYNRLSKVESLIFTE
ncbi:YigZ family protein [Dysgonomonas sp. Marseille-P4677]|uniref:IMPACT family protein n=1 Tax=Dysgonomonas sp. Marseille-P4677 TaxID=2364790 RepID=UPI001912DF2B|nr:YigZ family protein [Dysgonomonas sp. Marseille-P4677]MBK5722770.1 YigZ family protein [Dysgonomonas sp. Marseille-P4677]